MDQSVAQATLTGEWHSESGGIFNVQQNGDRVVWEAHSPDGTTWTHSFEGNLQGGYLRGWFYDHPPGRFRNRGPLTFEVRGDTLVRVSSGNAFADSTLTRAGVTPQMTTDPQDSKSAYETGNAYRDGRGVAKNWDTAIRWYMRAGNYSPALIALGDIYDQYQIGSRAVVWFEKAAELGDAVAMARAGKAYVEYPGLPDHYSKAIYWLTKAVAKGDTNAMVSMGLIYEKGRNVSQDMNTACGFYRRAAAGGNDAGMYDFANCYVSGEGMPRNPKLAISWYRKAIQGAQRDGDQELAEAASSNLNQAMNPQSADTPDTTGRQPNPFLEEQQREEMLRRTQDMINANRQIQMNTRNNQ